MCETFVLGSAGERTCTCIKLGKSERFAWRFEHSGDHPVKEASTWVCKKHEGSGGFLMLLYCFIGHLGFRIFAKTGLELLFISATLFTLRYVGTL